MCLVTRINLRKKVSIASHYLNTKGDYKTKMAVATPESIPT